MEDKTKPEDTKGSKPHVWNKAAKDYDKSRSTDSVYMSCINQTVSIAFRDGHTRLCLDAGCGTGMTSTEISKFCDLVIAVDYSYDSLRVLKNKKHRGGIIPVQADITKLPFKDSIFDNCICANTLQHLEPGNPQDCSMGELNRVTKDRCKLIVSVHHYSNDKRLAGWIKEGKPGQPGIDYIFRFSRSDLAKLMPGSKIRAIGFYKFARIPFFGGRMQNILAKIFGQVAAILGYGHMLIAEKRIKK